MSVDRSLKIKGMLSRHRNVLSRAERVETLKEEEKWQEGDSVLGLAKVAHRKSRAGKKAAEEKAAEAVAAEQTEAAKAPEAAEKSVSEKTKSGSEKTKK